MQEASRFYYLTDGRWLNHQDDLDGNKVIVIPRNFADQQDLQIGDSIRMTLRGLQDHYGWYIQGIDRENWRSYPDLPGDV